MPLSFDIEPRTLHFKFPAGTSRGVYRERKIWLIHLRDTSNPAFCGTGECAPLFDLSCDFSPEYEAQLRTECEAFANTGILDFTRLQSLPSIRFGLETALLAAQAHAKGSKLLFNTAFSRGEMGLPINGLVWMGNFDIMNRRLGDKLAQKFRCIKIKIGAIDFASELELLKRVRTSNDENLTLRVDANGAFSEKEAIKKLQQISDFQIHSIEQPIRAGQWNAMARLCRESPVPIALDEELIGIHTTAQKTALLDTIQPAYLVLKPTLHGGFSGCEEWIKLAEARHIGWWITSALESNIGLSAIAQWTAYLLEKRERHSDIRSPQNGRTAQAKHEYPAQGLGTGQLFTDNIPMPHLQMRGDELWYEP